MGQERHATFKTCPFRADDGMTTQKVNFTGTATAKFWEMLISTRHYKVLLKASLGEYHVFRHGDAVPQRQAGAMKVRLRGPLHSDSEIRIIVAIHLVEKRVVASGTHMHPERPASKDLRPSRGAKAHER